MRSLAIAALAAFAAASPSGVRAQAACPANVAPGSRCDVGASDAGAAPGTAVPSTRLGNPIDLVTGTKRQAETDLSIDGAPLGLVRFYSSAGTDANLGVGRGWRHTYLVRLHADSAGGRVVDDSTGRRLTFSPPSPEAPERFPALLPSDGHLVARDDGEHVWVVPDGRRLRFLGTFPVRIDWPDGRFLRLSYGEGRLVAVTDETGRALRFEYAPGRPGLPGFDRVEFGARPGHLSAVVLPDASRVEYDYDNLGNLTRARYGDGTSRTYVYEDALWPSRLTGLVDRTGARFATWRYDERGRAISSERADGVERVMLGFGPPVADGEVGTTTVTNAEGAISTYRWRRDSRTGAGLLLEALGPGCATCPPTRRRYAYDAAGRLVRAARLGEGGGEVSARSYVHDDRSRLVRIDETVFGADGLAETRLVERLRYDGDSRRVAFRALPSVDPDAERTIEIERDAAGLPVRIVERGRSPRFGLDRRSSEPVGFEPIERAVRLVRERGRIVAVDGPREDVEDVVRIDRDAAGRIERVRPPGGPALAIEERDAYGRPASVRVGGRSPHRIERDDRGRVVRVSVAGESIRYGRDAEGRVTSVTDADGRTVVLERDAAGRLASATDDLGRSTSRVHDAESRTIERIDRGADGAALRSLAYVFDADGRLARSLEAEVGADGRARAPRTLEHGHGADGLTRTLTALERGAAATVALDPVARLGTIASPNGAVTRIAFDVAGRGVALTDARGNTTRNPTDDFGRRVMHESPDAGRTLLALDAAGNPSSTRHEDGTVVRYVHDAAGRLVERVSPDTVTSWRWDPAEGTLVEAATWPVGGTLRDAPTTVERFDYDADARLVRHERAIGEHRFVTGYVRDARGRIAEKSLPDGRVLVHHYHVDGPERGGLRAITLKRRFGLRQAVLVAEIDGDGRDGETGYSSPGGVRSSRRFAPNGEPVESTLAGEAHLVYQVDEHGRIVGVEENGVGRRYGYDGARLAVAVTAKGRTAWRFDAVGNRLERRHRSADGTLVAKERYRYGPPGEGNRLLQVFDEVTGRAVPRRYAAPNGVPTAIGELTYEYDAERRPVTVRRGGALLARYAYNAFGERVAKTVFAPGAPSETTYFLYDGHALTAEIDGRGEVVAQYVYLDGHRPAAMLRGDALYGVHVDRRGAPRFVTDERGRTVWSAAYAPYGRLASAVGDVPMPLRLPGQYEDAETGSHYNYFRDYDPDTGRYLTSDPIGLAGGVNPYAYAYGDPLNAIDPLGLAVYLFDRDLDGFFYGKHKFIVLVPDKPSDFVGRTFHLNGDDFQMQDLGDGTMGFVMGAQNENGRLVLEAFNAADTLATQQYYDPSITSPFRPDFSARGQLCSTSPMRSDTEVIMGMLATMDAYARNEELVNIRYPSNGQQLEEDEGFVNSNSWAHTVLDVNGLHAPDLPNWAGSDKLSGNRLDEDYFDATATAEDLERHNADSDGDGVLDNLDPDDDGDGVIDELDAARRDPNRS